MQSTRLQIGNLSGAMLLFLCSSLASAGILGGWPQSTTAATVVLAIFVALQIYKVPRQQLFTGLFLVLIGSLAAFPEGGIIDSAIKASKGTLIFVALFVAVAFLQYPALNSPSMFAVREVIVSQPAGRRYATLTLSAHFFGALTNFAALSLLSTFLFGNLDTNARERMACAMIRGFALAASWSPFFVSVAVILYIMPDLSWFRIALPGVPLAFLLLVYGWGFDRMAHRKPPPPGSKPIQAPAPVKLEAETIYKIGVLGLVLVGSILFVSETLAVSMPIAIFLVTPLISVIWQALLSRRDGHGSLGEMAKSVIENISKLRAEIVVFLSANFLGYSAALIIDPATISSTLINAGIYGWSAIFVLLGFMLMCTMLMVHPLVLIVLLGQIFPGEALGVQSVSLALCMSAIWGVGTPSSPGSGLTLFMTRILERSPWYVSWRLNAAYSVGGIVVAGVYIAIVNRWFLL
ncbi:hypothetical protein L2D14_05660 [Thalassospiraceae bacterium LMO-JJ14]|nr:hypothetical protein L2D14_05660 [Thalassospiraceae bacterium LMO-JJ14]